MYFIRKIGHLLKDMRRDPAAERSSIEKDPDRSGAQYFISTAWIKAKNRPRIKKSRNET